MGPRVIIQSVTKWVTCVLRCNQRCVLHLRAPQGRILIAGRGGPFSVAMVTPQKQTRGRRKGTTHAVPPANTLRIHNPIFFSLLLFIVINKIIFQPFSQHLNRYAFTTFLHNCTYNLHVFYINTSVRLYISLIFISYFVVTQ